jgi:hypothetical protein
MHNEWMVSVEILHVDECPSWETAEARTREALESLGRPDIPVSTRLLLTAEDAARSAFAGSPTITLDGTDLFPTEGRASDLACRVYVTPEGLRGAPTVDQIVDALRSRL